MNDSDDIKNFASDIKPNTDSTPVTVVSEPTNPTVVEEQRESGRVRITTTPGAPGENSVASVVVERISNAPFVVEVSGVLKAQKPFENPLHDYASYTYNLSLHMITIDMYNEIINANFVNESPKPYVPKHVLISGAGRYNSTDFQRNKNFVEDFYFEDFKMQTVISPTMRNRNTNLIEGSFTIIEPNGFTLINRMIAAANEINKNKLTAPESYIRMPYVLQIDFFGYKEIGDTKPEKISDLTKIIPICLVNIETQLRQSGAEYIVTMTAYNHQVFNQINSTVPFHTTQKNVTTVAKAFMGGINNAVAEQLQQIDDKRKSLEREKTDWQNAKDQATINVRVDPEGYANINDYNTKLSRIEGSLREVNNTLVPTTGICSALNTFYKRLVETGNITYPTTFSVEFDPEIGNSKLFTGPQPSTTTSAGTSALTNINFNAGTINIPAGSTLDKIIDFVVRHSDYVLDQISGNTDDITQDLRRNILNGRDIAEIVPRASRPLNWYKIVPTLKVGAWDNKLKRFSAEKIVLYVRSFKISSKYPYGPKGRVPGYVKKYDYMFTGRNRDVIDWNINFNCLYALAVTAGLNKVVQDATGKGLNSSGAAADPDKSTGVTKQSSSGTDSLAQPVIVPTAGTAENNILSGGNTQKSVAAADLARSLLLDARADMVELELKIIGDPHFIKQDDIFYSRPKAGENFALTPNKSLYMDTGELYVFVNFLSPVDYDEEKGLAQVKANEMLGNDEYEPPPLNSTFSYSSFNGVYKLITVDNVFNKGKFEQTLRMAKILFDQIGVSYEDRLNQTTNINRASNAVRATADSSQFGAEINARNAFLDNFTGVSLTGEIFNYTQNEVITAVGRVTDANEVRKISLATDDDDISNNNQALILTATTVAPSIKNIDWGLDGVNALS